MTLIVYDSRGGQATLIKSVSVLPPNVLPVASFTVDKATLAIYESTNFNDFSNDSDGNILNWNWDFGDGVVIDQAYGSISHSFATAGVYTVTLTLTDDRGGQDVATKTMNVVADSSASYQLVQSRQEKVKSFELRGAPDANQQIRTYSLTQAPEVGKLMGCLEVAFSTDLSCWYIPPYNFQGRVTFSYTAFDENQVSLNQYWVVVNVRPAQVLVTTQAAPVRTNTSVAAIAAAKMQLKLAIGEEFSFDASNVSLWDAAGNAVSAAFVGSSASSELVVVDDPSGGFTITAQTQTLSPVVLTLFDGVSASTEVMVEVVQATAVPTALLSANDYVKSHTDQIRGVLDDGLSKRVRSSFSEDLTHDLSELNAFTSSVTLLPGLNVVDIFTLDEINQPVVAPQTLATVEAFFGRAETLKFSGTQQAVLDLGSQTLSSGAFTVSFFVNPGVLSEDATWMSWGDWTLAMTTRNEVVFKDSVNSEFVASAPLRSYAWTHVSVSYDGSNQLSLFIDGLEVASQSSVTLSYPGSQNATLGFVGAAATQDIAIDEFRLWSVALSEAQLFAEMFSPAADSDANSVLHIDFDGVAAQVYGDDIKDGTMTLGSSASVDANDAQVIAPAFQFAPQTIGVSGGVIDLPAGPELQDETSLSIPAGALTQDVDVVLEVLGSDHFDAAVAALTNPGAVVKIHGVGAGKFAQASQLTVPYVQTLLIAGPPMLYEYNTTLGIMSVLAPVSVDTINELATFDVARFGTYVVAHSQDQRPQVTYSYPAFTDVVAVAPYTRVMQILSPEPGTQQLIDGTLDAATVIRHDSCQGEAQMVGGTFPQYLFNLSPGLNTCDIEFVKPLAGKTVMSEQHQYQVQIQVAQ